MPKRTASERARDEEVAEPTANKKISLDPIVAEPPAQPEKVVLPPVGHVDDGHDDDDDEAAMSIEARRAARRQRDAELSRSCPFLMTVRREYLDFDMEKVCSVSLSDQHVYACLVCGHYFQGNAGGTRRKDTDGVFYCRARADDIRVIA